METPKNGARLFLRGCARCSAFLAADPQQMPPERSGAFMYCGRCRKIVLAEEARRPFRAGARAVHVDYQRGPFAVMVIREIRDGRARVTRLGAPDGVPASAVAFHHTIGREWFARAELIMQAM